MIAAVCTSNETLFFDSFVNLMNECACGLILRIRIVGAMDVVVVVTEKAIVVCVANMSLSLLNLKPYSFHLFSTCVAVMRHICAKKH